MPSRTITPYVPNDPAGEIVNTIEANLTQVQPKIEGLDAEATATGVNYTNGHDPHEEPFVPPPPIDDDIEVIYSAPTRTLRSKPNSRKRRRGHGLAAEDGLDVMDANDPDFNPEDDSEAAVLDEEYQEDLLSSDNEPVRKKPKVGDRSTPRQPRRNAQGDAATDKMDDVQPDASVAGPMAKVGASTNLPRKVRLEDPSIAQSVKTPVKARPAAGPPVAKQTSNGTKRGVTNKENVVEPTSDHD